jgi:2'-5' RNA ligase
MLGEQGEFEFYGKLPRRPSRPERLFFSLFPDTATSLRVKEFAERFVGERHLIGRQLKAERLHVSLHHVGDYRRLRSQPVFAARCAGQGFSMHGFEVNVPVHREF